MALTKDRDIQRRDAVFFRDPVAATARIHAGALVVLDASGNAMSASVGGGLVVRGVAQEAVDNTAGAAGDKWVTTRRGLFNFKNSTGTDEITRADIGKPAYVVDDETVARTHNAGTRITAGFIRDVDASGVWVEIFF